MKSDLTDLKQLTLELIKNDDSTEVKEKKIIEKFMEIKIKRKRNIT